LKNTSEYEQLKKQLEEVHLEKEKKKRRSRELKRKNQEDHEFSNEEVEDEEKVIKGPKFPHLQNILKTQKVKNPK